MIDVRMRVERKCQLNPELMILYLVFGRTHLGGGVNVLESFVARTFNNTHHQILIIDNQLPAGKNSHHGPYRIIGGDNRSREFSGWDQGLVHLQKKTSLHDMTICLLANDTFHRNYGLDYLNLFNPEKVRRQVAEGAMVGYVDGYPRPIHLFGLKVQYWVRSSFFIIRWGGLKKLLPLSLPLSNQELFSTDKVLFFRQPSKLSDNYQRYLKNWLFQTPDVDDEFKEAWHSKGVLSIANLHDFQGKARSIICEHYLSARAISLGISLRSVNLNFI
jgi:hypothetical protein